MKRVATAAFRSSNIIHVLAGVVAVLILTTASAQNTPPTNGGQNTPPTAGGQNAPPSPGAPRPANVPPPPRKGLVVLPPSTNPLLIRPRTGTGEDAGIVPPSEFSDYRQATAVGVPHANTDKLPTFGYDFFQPARDLVLARRAYLRRQYQGPNLRDNTSSPQTTPKPRDPNSPPETGDNAGVKPADRSDVPRDATGAPQAQDNPRTRPASAPAVPRVITLPDGTTVTVPAATQDTGSPAPGADPGARNGGAGQIPGTPPADQTAPAQNATDNAASAAGNAASSPRRDSVNAFEEVADPLSQLYRNVVASVPPSYRLGQGDALNVRYWSPRHETKTQTYVVDAGGAITIEDVGLLVVRGLTLEQAEKTIGARLRRIYNGVEVSVTLGRLRTIQVTLTGAAFQPGTYTVPSVATAYNVLYAAGGPLEDGSLRSIEVRRGGKIVGSLDLYHFLLVGNRGEDIALESGDLIYIPHRRSRIAVTGEVLQPAIFELRDKETLKDVLEYAGGVRASAVAQRVRINTVDPGNGRIQKDVDLGTASGGMQTLYDGDDVEVFSVRPLITNSVAIEGAVDQPSTYALTPGMRVSDLIERARGVISEAYVTRANLYRWNANNTTTLITINLLNALAHDPAADIPLERWDRLTVFTRKEVAWTGQRTLSVRGAVQRAGSYTLSDNMRVSDLLLLAGGPSPDAYLDRAVLLHQHGDGTFGMDFVNIGGLRSKDPAQDVILQDNDVLAVYRTGEAQFEPEHVVTIRGEVVASGPFPRTSGMHLSDLIKLAGGFKPGASPSVDVAHARRSVGASNAGPNLVRVRFDEKFACAKQDDVLIEDGDVVTVQGTGGFVDTVRVVEVRGAVYRPGPIIMTGTAMRLTDALAAAGGLRPEAFASGAEFYRDPRVMTTDSQHSLTGIIGSLNDLLNESTYNRERGKSYVDRIRSVNTAEQPDIPSIGAQAAPQNSGVTGALAAGLAQQDLVSPARKLTDDQLVPNGNIAVNLAEALRHPKGAEDILLVSGDTITVPETPTTIQVVGAVFHGRGVLYKPGAKLDYYVEQTGGFAPDAARDRVEVIHVGGGLVPAVKASLLPGDVIVVPTRVLAAKIDTHKDTFGSFFKSLTSSAIIFRVATSLFGL